MHACIICLISTVFYSDSSNFISLIFLKKNVFAMSLPEYPKNDVINDVKLAFSPSRGNTLEVVVGLREAQTGGRQPSL